MAKRPIKVAVIGAGNMGRNHVRNYALLPEADLVGLADINPDSQKLATEYKTRYFADYKQMLDAVKPEAVSVVVPTPLHVTVGQEVMKRGIHCLMEKPIAHSLEEADTLITLAKKHKVVFTVGHIERYNPIIRKLKEIVSAGRLGEITSIVCRRVGGFPAREPKTDVILDLAVHDIDIINHLLERHPTTIFSHGSRTHHSKEIDSTEILLDYGAASGFVQANWLTPVKIRTISVTGSKGCVEGNYITQDLAYYKHNIVREGDFSDFVISMGKLEEELIKVDFEEPLALELRSFLAGIGGERGRILVTPEDAREALRVALTASAKVQP